MEQNSQPLHSEETEDIITKPPSRIIRWGITMFVVTLMILISLSFLIHYPDLIRTRMVIYASGSSKPLRANTGGRLIRLLVSQGQCVIPGQPLAFIEASVSHEDVMSLSKDLNGLKDNILKNSGEPDKALVAQAYKLKSRFVAVFQGERPVQQSADVQLCQNCRASLINEINTLIAYTGKWLQEYMVVAPQAGTVSVIGLLTEGQLLKAGQPLFYIDGGGLGFYGEMSIPQYEIGKVKKGQKVMIKLTGYRFEDFGIINGTIDTIGELPYNDSVFVSRVKFNNAYNKNIILKSGLSAESDIVSKDVSLADRLINTLKKAISTQ